MAPSPYCCPCAFSLHAQQKSWSLPTQMRTETRSKFESLLDGPRAVLSAPAPWPASPSFRRRSSDRHGRGVDYSIALVERPSAFFIMLIGFEWVRPRLTPGT